MSDVALASLLRIMEGMLGSDGEGAWAVVWSRGDKGNGKFLGFIKLVTKVSNVK